MAPRLSRPSRWLFLAWLHKLAHDPQALRPWQINRTVHVCPDTGVADDHRCRFAGSTPIGFSYEGILAAESPPLGLAHALGFFCVWAPLDLDVRVDRVDGEGRRSGWGIGTCVMLRGSRLRRRGLGRAFWWGAIAIRWFGYEVRRRQCGVFGELIDIQGLSVYLGKVFDTTKLIE